MKKKAMWAANSAATILLCIFTLAVGTTTSASAENVKIRFTLDWLPQSTHGPFFIALYKGYYKREGLDVSIDEGKGSGDAVTRIVSGAYEMGSPDINNLIEFNSKNPEKAIPEVLMLFEQGPFGIFVMKKSGITNPQQLEGKTVGSPVFDASYRLLSAFAKAVGIDLKKVTLKNMEPRLREAMLVRGQVDAITGFVFSSMLDLEAKGVKEDQVRSFMYKDYGLDFYANGVAVSRAFLKEHPDAVRGFVRATIKGLKDMIQDPELAVKMVLKFEPMLNPDIERNRLKLGLQCCILTPNVVKNGYGDVDMARLKRAIDQVAFALRLKRTPTSEEMFDRSFLPPKKQRMLDVSCKNTNWDLVKKLCSTQ